MEVIAQSLGRITKVISQSSKQRKSNVNDDVADKMQKTLSLWNSMMNGLGETTNLNISQLTEKSDFYQSRVGSTFSSLSQGKPLFLTV